MVILILLLSVCVTVISTMLISIVSAMQLEAHTMQYTSARLPVRLAPKHKGAKSLFIQDPCIWIIYDVLDACLPWYTTNEGSKAGSQVSV